VAVRKLKTLDEEIDIQMERERCERENRHEGFEL